MTGHDIRTKFLEFFRSKGHAVIASDSLVPKDDPTVLFTTAGMQQFKPQFMGHLTGFTRAATSQKCLRTDDLTEVGVTDFHHTMFEMLGNFSFGDYFKREAIVWAWEFLTREMGIPAEKLWVSVHKDDEEAYGIWLNDIKLSPARIVKLGDKSNFWPSNARLNGPNGPCGPCSEIFFDWGANGCTNPSCDPDCSCGRFCEVWNLVFTQYNRKDGGLLEPLPAKNIDTGMGLERLTAVIQGKRNNFESDLFMPLMAAVHQAVAAQGAAVSLRETRLIVDHIRAVTFGICDGVIPSNEGRGYVMRKLVVDMANILIQAGITKPLIHTFVPAVVRLMQGPYPELVGKEKDMVDTVRRVEEAVIKLNREKVPELDAYVADIKSRKVAPAVLVEELGDKMFGYRDTYGLPMNLIQAKMRDSFSADIQTAVMAVVDRKMAEQKERSRAASKMQGDVFLSGDVDIKGVAKTVFLGYDQPACESVILKIFMDGQAVDTVQEGHAVTVVLDKTPFYAEQGGQCADTGLILAQGSVLRVQHVRKVADVYVHAGVVDKGMFKVNAAVSPAIDGERRMAVARNHTATHLLQAALRRVLGEHVKQQGSLVDADRLRFDFTHPKAVSRQEIDKIEDMVNMFVRSCDRVSMIEMTREEAAASGALAFFAEKYGDAVRVVTVGEHSKEFCGGTHLCVTGQIGFFRIAAEGAVAQGIRRIEAVTGTGALAYT
ncbi:MAG: alanine--tRNA ligase, partial [Candidatus Omnitrophota bacterium]